MYTMAAFVPLIGAILVTLNVLQCSCDIVSVINKVEDLNQEVFQVRKDVTRVEERVLNTINLAKISLRSELKQYLHQYVAEAMGDIIQGESIEEMVRSQVLSEVRQLKRGNHQMKRQLHRVLTSNRGIQEELETYKDALKKTDSDAVHMKTCSKYIVDSEILRRDLVQCKGNTENYQKGFAEKDLELNETKLTLDMLNQSYHLQLRNIENSVTTRESHTPELSTSATTVTTAVKHEEERSRIIVAPAESYTHHQFRLINIHSNSVTTYCLHSLTYVTSLVYISRKRMLLIGQGHPHKIISSTLDSNNVNTVREHVRTYGMAVDEERELVFMTILIPRYTISRMTTEGKTFTTIIGLSSYDSAPLTIAVNTKENKSYACNQGTVFLTTYDGEQLQTLATGSYMFALTLGNTGTIVYYNDGKKLMSWSQNVTREVTTLSARPWNIIYDKNTVYFSSQGSPATVGAVDVAHDTVVYTLQQNIIKGVDRYAICLYLEIFILTDCVDTVIHYLQVVI